MRAMRRRVPLSLSLLYLARQPPGYPPHTHTHTTTPTSLLLPSCYEPRYVPPARFPPTPVPPAPVPLARFPPTRRSRARAPTRLRACAAAPFPCCSACARRPPTPARARLAGAARLPCRPRAARHSPMRWRHPGSRSTTQRQPHPPLRKLLATPRGVLDHAACVRAMSGHPATQPRVQIRKCLPRPSTAVSAVNPHACSKRSARG